MNQELPNHLGLKISLVIPAYNEEKYIKACLESIALHSAGLLHEVIVVDNDSLDNTEVVANETAKLVYPSLIVKVVKEEKKGTSAARQRGLDEAAGDLIGFIDADSIMPKGWCETVLREFGKNPNLAALSGPYKYYDMPLWQRAVVIIFWHTLAYPLYLMTRYMAMGGNLVMRKSVLEKMGGLDTTISFYGDDTDMVRRASKFGKIKFKFNFTIGSSARRFHGQGLLKTTLIYAANFFSQVFAKRSITKDANHDSR